MRLRGTFLVALLMSLTLGDADEPRIIICDFGVLENQLRGDRPKMYTSEIDPTLCTHLMGTDIIVTANGDVRFNDKWDDGRYGDIRKLNALRRSNPQLRILVARRADLEEFSRFSTDTIDPTLRSSYVKNVVDFLLRNGLNGIEFELGIIVYVEGSEKLYQNYLLLFKEFRETFDKHKLIFCASMLWNGRFVAPGLDITELWKYPHFINLWTFDYIRGSGLTADHFAPLYSASRETEMARSKNVNATVRDWLNHGVPAEKIVVAITSWGAAYNLTDSAKHVPGSSVIPRPELGSARDVTEALRFGEICKLTSHSSQDSWTSVWDEEQRVPYAFSEGQWISFDNVKSVEEKARFVKALGLGGVMFSNLNGDDYLGLCGEKYPLLKAVNRVLRDTRSINFDEYAKRRCAMYNHKYIRHPENCATFWICQKDHGHDFVAEPFSCAEGLHFDTNKEACERSYLADCG